MWSYLLEILVFHEVPQAWTIVGVGLILASLGVIALEKHQEAQTTREGFQMVHTEDESGDDTNDESESNGTLQLQTLDSKGVGSR